MTHLAWISAPLAGFLLLGAAAWAGEKKEPAKKDGGKIAPVDDPALAGEPVQEQSEYEKLLFTEYRKRRTEHFWLETSFDDDTCKDTIAFLEQAYRDFLKWAGKAADTDLWGSRCHVALIHNKAEWECLLTHRFRGEPAHLIEEYKKLGGIWGASPPNKIQYSNEGSDPQSDKMNLFHSLSHQFLHGIAGSGDEGQIWWLWEAFSWHRSIEVFGSRGGSCVSFETKATTAEDRAWNDIDDWVELLKRDVKAKQDEDFALFWQKDVMAIQQKTYVKGWSIVRYLVRDEKEKAKFVNFVSLLKVRGDQARALKEVYGWTPDDLDKAWREWVRNQPTRWRKAADKPKK